MVTIRAPTLLNLYNSLDLEESFVSYFLPHLVARPGSSIGCAAAWHPDNRRFNPRVQQLSLVEIGHEIISIYGMCT